METVQVIIRPYAVSDAGYIYQTWTKNLYYGMNPRPDPKQDWYKEKFHVIDKLIKKSPPLVACLSYDPDFIVGYLVVNKKKIEWLYIRPAYRSEGIEELLTGRLRENYEKSHSEDRTTDHSDAVINAGSFAPR